DVLQVGPEHAAADAGDLATDAAEVFRLAAAGDLIAEDGFLPANVALHAHTSSPFPKTLNIVGPVENGHGAALHGWQHGSTRIRQENDHNSLCLYPCASVSSIRVAQLRGPF